MLNNYNTMHLSLAVISINIMCCYCYVNYEIFKGFGQYITEISSRTDAVSTTDNDYTSSTENQPDAENITQTPTHTMDDLATLTTRKPIQTQFKTFNRKCPEKEDPANLGSYVIPTERDLVLFTMRTLQKMFNIYHQKTLFLLKDIYEVTKTTRDNEKQCVGKSKKLYRTCVQRVSKKCAAVVKDLVATVDNWQHSVADLTEGRACNMAALKTDPLQLIKILAMEEASLEFALPAFLRLIGECSAHCFRPSDGQHIIHPRVNKLTNQDLIVRHFLTNKTNIQFIRNSDMQL